VATTGGIELSTDDLREVARCAARCAEQALEIVEAVRPDDARPREAVDAAHAAQLAAGGDKSDASARLAAARSYATPALVDVLRRYPSAPGGGGRVGELVRRLDAALRDGSVLDGTAPGAGGDNA